MNRDDIAPRQTSIRRGPCLSSTGMPAMTTWLSRAVLILALLSAVTAVLAGFGSRTGWWHFRTGFQILTWAAYGGLASAVLGLLSVVVAFWRRPRAGIWSSLVAVTIGLIVV